MNAPAAASQPAETGFTGRARRWPAFLVVGLLGAAIGMTGFTFNYAEGLSYLSDDPKACINCHVMQAQYDAWQHASHRADATCNDCHVPHDSVIRKYLVKAEHGYRHGRGFTFNDFHEPIQITPSSRAVVVENCGRCHADIAADTTVQARTLTAAGAAKDAANAADCLHCHSQVGHGPSR
jgi:cytochrome c nitrite reductase small subunit